jgi:hypothetical protein
MPLIVNGDPPDGFREMICNMCEFDYISLCYEDTAFLQCPNCKWMQLVDNSRKRIIHAGSKDDR